MIFPSEAFIAKAPVREKNSLSPLFLREKIGKGDSDQVPDDLAVPAERSKQDG